MSKAHIFHHLPHSADNMTDLVASVDRYKEFIGPISDLRMRSMTEISDTQYEFEAEVVISYKIISETFQCHVKVDTARHTVNVSKAGKKGAVKSLINHWTFHPLDDGSTLLEFVIDVTLKSKVLNMLVKAKFDAATDYLVTKFENRAKAVYPIVDSKHDQASALAELKLS